MQSRQLVACFTRITSTSLVCVFDCGARSYRSDCSGFVSASWNVPPPGAVTQSFPAYAIAESDLQRGDALLMASDHVALFWGWAAPGQPIVVEECGAWARPGGGGGMTPRRAQATRPAAAEPRRRAPGAAGLRAAATNTALVRRRRRRCACARTHTRCCGMRPELCVPWFGDTEVF